jgi:hypothetical protein
MKPQDPNEITCHQQWCDLLTAELRRVLEQGKGKSARNLYCSMAGIQHRNRTAFEQSIVFENFRLQTHADAMSVLHVTTTIAAKKLTEDIKATPWYKPRRKARLKRQLADERLKEACFKEAFLVLVNTPVPPPPDQAAPPAKPAAPTPQEAEKLKKEFKEHQASKPTMNILGNAVPCDRCNGTGYADGMAIIGDAELCERCKGSGIMPAKHKAEPALQEGGPKA